VTTSDVWKLFDEIRVHVFTLFRCWQDISRGATLWRARGSSRRCTEWSRSTAVNLTLWVFSRVSTTKSRTSLSRTPLSATWPTRNRFHPSCQCWRRISTLLRSRSRVLSTSTTDCSNYLLTRLSSQCWKLEEQEPTSDATEVNNNNNNNNVTGDPLFTSFNVFLLPSSRQMQSLLRAHSDLSESHIQP